MKARFERIKACQEYYIGMEKDLGWCQTVSCHYNVISELGVFRFTTSTVYRKFAGFLVRPVRCEPAWPGGKGKALSW